MKKYYEARLILAGAAHGLLIYRSDTYEKVTSLVSLLQNPSTTKDDIRAVLGLTCEITSVMLYEVEMSGTFIKYERVS